MTVTADEIRTLLADLAEERRVFCSELDFQLHLAWAIKERGWEVVLEYDPQCFERNAAIDILVIKPQRIAIELKYKTTRFECEIDGLQLRLKQQGAQTIAHHDLINDVSRVETVVASGRADRGFTIVLTNDASYWREGRRGTAAEMFRMHHGRKLLRGELRWGANASEGTMDGRTEPIVLMHDYAFEWRDYSKFECKNGVFRYLLVEVEPIVLEQLHG